MKRFFQIGAGLTAIILGTAPSAKADAIALDFGLTTDTAASAAGGKTVAASAWTTDLALSFDPSSTKAVEPSSARRTAVAKGLPPLSNTPVDSSTAPLLPHSEPGTIPTRSAAPLAFKADPQTGSPDLFAGDANSLVARAVGSAEGTRTPEGGYTAAYYGHRDPGNGVWNLGSFSYQHGARSPEEADEKQLKRLKAQAANLKQQADYKGLTLSLQEELNGIDLANQAPLAALDRGYIDWLDQAHQLNMPEDEGVLWARTRSFLDPDTGKWNAPGLGNTVYSISHDQARRQRAIARAIDVYKQRRRESTLVAMAPTSAPMSLPELAAEPTAMGRERVDFFLSMDVFE